MIQEMKWPASIANYLAKPPRQLWVVSKCEPMLKWCGLVLRKHEAQKKMVLILRRERMEAMRGEGSNTLYLENSKQIPLYNYVKFIISKGSYRTKDELMKGMLKKGNRNFEMAATHPNVDTLCAKGFAADKLLEQEKSLREMIMSIKDDAYPSSTYYPIDKSARIFKQWCRVQCINVNDFVNSIWDIMSKKLSKVNMEYQILLKPYLEMLHRKW